MDKKTVIFSFALLLLFSSYVLGAGTSSGDFLNIGVGAGPVGRGEAYAGFLGGVESVYWNPAGIADQKLVEFFSTHTDWFDDTTFQNVGIVVPANRIGPVGLSYSLLNYGNITGYTTSGARSSDISASDSAITLTWAKRINKKLTGGTNLKYVSSVLDGIAANTIAVDLGFIYEVKPALNFAVVSKNQLGRLKYISEEASLPSAVTIGLAASPFILEPLSVAADYTFSNSESNYLNLGAEYYFIDNFALRIGSSKSRLQGGIGFRASAFNIDYAYVPYENLGATHRVSFSLSFGINKQEEIRIYYQKGKELYRRKKYLDALVQFKKALEIDSLDKDSREFVDRIVEEMRQETLQEKTKSLIERKKEAQELLKKAVIAFQEKEYADAGKLINEALKLAPNNREARELQERLIKVIRIENRE